MLRILVLTFRTPFPLTDGARIRIYNVGKILAQRYPVDLLAINEGRVAHEHLKELGEIFNKVNAYPFHPLRFKINTLKGLLSRDSLQIYYHHFGKAQRWIDRHYADYDVLFCFHIRMTRYLRKITDKPKVIDFIDATSINYREAQERARGIWRFIYRVENRRLLAYELKMRKEFDKAFITSPFDKAYLDENSGHPNDNLVVIPNGVKEELFTRSKRFEGKEEDWLVFLGKMNYAPNVDAVTYFAKEIFPLVRQKANVKFFIVGTSPAKEVLRLGEIDGVEVTGFVEDPYEYLERAKLVVVPLRFSAGIQNKVLEAMALRKAVVTTTKAARGIEGEDRRHFIIADDEEGMASKILKLLADESRRKEIGENARELVEAKYRWDSVGEKLLKEIEEVLKR
ncbi:MAG: glycosyltransferase [Deltaproteobacteria bacterium]|nr:glycosyltransferase [Deltaproteobacteria bacterium]